MTIVEEAGKVTRHGKSAKRAKSEAKPTTCALCGATPNKLVDSHGNLVCEPCAQAVGMDQQVAAAEAPKRARKQKASPAAREASAEAATAPAAAATPPPRSMAALAAAYAEAMRVAGNTPSTVRSYELDLALAVRELGPDTLVAAVTPAQVRAFNESEVVTLLRTGGQAAQPSILKRRRVLRLALVWAVSAGWIATAPIPPAE